jgi:hypothetical protein
MFGNAGKCNEGHEYFKLLRLSLDKSSMQRKRSTCSYVFIHKTYLKMRGFDLNHIFSLKRNRMNDEAKTNCLNMSRG